MNFIHNQYQPALFPTDMRTIGLLHMTAEVVDEETKESPVKPKIFVDSVSRNELLLCSST